MKQNSLFPSGPVIKCLLLHDQVSLVKANNQKQPIRLLYCCSIYFRLWLTCLYEVTYISKLVDRFLPTFSPFWHVLTRQEWRGREDAERFVAFFWKYSSHSNPNEDSCVRIHCMPNVRFLCKEFSYFWLYSLYLTFVNSMKVYHRITLLRLNYLG